MDKINKIEEKESLIIKAASERFAHFGFAKVTMDEIAEDVAMGKASLYYYFPTKKDLFRSVIEYEQNEFIQNAESILKKEIAASKKIELYVKQRLQYFQILLNLGTLNVHSFIESNPIFKKLFQDFEKQELIIFKEMIDEGIRKKEFKKNLPSNISNIFLHTLQGLRLRTLRLIKEWQLKEEEYEELKQEMIIAADIFIKGIKTNKN